MKKKLTTILAMCLCAIMMVTAINPSTAYAAEKTPVKVTFKKKTVTLGKDINTKPAQPKVKTLTKKWGKPKKETDEYAIYYTWTKGKTEISYRLMIGEPDSPSDCTYIRFDAYDKNLTVNGIRVGMKQEKADKIIKDLGGETTDYSASLDLRETSGFLISYMCDKGKVSSINVELTYAYR
ncbi:MAG: hypothetical protein HFJ41_08495 [Clostridia bacterium]|nr:hypothetical protein [Clostridia bacterium]